MSTSGLSRKQQASSRPHFRAVRKVLWKMVKNCVRNRSTPDDIDTETEICTSLKSEFYFRFRWPPSTKSTLISYTFWVFVTIRGKICQPQSRNGQNWHTSVVKYVHHNREIAKIRICTTLKSGIYFRFVSETIIVGPATFPSRMQNFLKIGKVPLPDIQTWTSLHVCNVIHCVQILPFGALQWLTSVSKVK